MAESSMDIGIEKNAAGVKPLVLGGVGVGDVVALATQGEHYGFLQFDDIDLRRREGAVRRHIAPANGDVVSQSKEGGRPKREAGLDGTARGVGGENERRGIIGNGWRQDGRDLEKAAVSTRRRTGTDSIKLFSGFVPEEDFVIGGANCVGGGNVDKCKASDQSESISPNVKIKAVRRVGVAECVRPESSGTKIIPGSTLRTVKSVAPATANLGNGALSRRSPVGSGAGRADARLGDVSAATLGENDAVFDSLDSVGRGDVFNNGHDFTIKARSRE